MSNNDTLPVWKKFYQVISGSNQHLTRELIDDILEICQDKLVKVLLDFKLYSKQSFEEWRTVSQSMLISQDDEMCSFIHRLSRELDLDVNTSWSVICNFLIFEYFGKVGELKSIIRYEANIKSIIDHVWYFYSADRMFLLKTLRYIFEKLPDKEHTFFEQFNTFIEAIDLKDLWKNLINTFENLLTEINVEKSYLVPPDTLTKWIQRNNREQVEVLLLMIHVIDLVELDGDELVVMFQLFMRHGFGRHPAFYGAGTMSRPRDVVDIRNAEIGVILTLIYKYLLNDEMIKMLPRDMERDLETYQIQGDNSAIIFIWIVFKSTLSASYVDGCKATLETLVKKKCFKSFADFLTLDIFQNCKVGEIIVEGTNRLFEIFKNLVDEPRFIFEQDGVVKILCELFKRPHLYALERFGQYFEIALDMFPYLLDNFLDMAEALLISDNYYNKMMRLLHNCPSYCTELAWPYMSDAVHSIDERNLFLGTDRFVIPIGTLTERCTCYGYDVIKFNYKHDYFDVIEQYMRSLTMWALNRGEYNKLIFDYVIRAYKFLTVLVKNYKGDFKEDTVIRPLMQRLDCVPTYYNKGSFRNFEFFYVYFEAKCTLMIYQDINIHEAFPIIIRKTLFPTILDYKHAREELKTLQTTNECFLWTFLKQEEGCKDHKLLLKYTEILLHILKKNMLHKDVLYSGIWYLLNIVFPNHQQWNFDDGAPFQEVKLVKGCLQIFTKVLQQDTKKLKSEEQQELYLLVHQAFLTNASIINSLCGMFIKNKFFLQNLMHQETNWTGGPTLVVIESVRLELILLLLIFKCRARIPREECLIDDRTQFFAKAASGYFINPYNPTLAVLAGRFLEILARDENIPLMSCLGLGLDQIQTLFLERLRDPMEDGDVKLNILNLISSCIIHQTGMTAAFFNIQSSKKWYNADTAPRIEADTVGDFMIDYLQNIKKSVSYLKSPLQVGVLKVMANLWQCEKQHLIKEVTTLPTFWPLLADPLFRTFDQSPLVYSYLLKILGIQFTMALRNPEGQDKFFSTIQKFLTDQKQLRMFQQFLFKLYSTDDFIEEHFEERELLLQSWCEVLVTAQKQDTVLHFPNSECKYLFIDLAFDGFLKDAVNQHIFSIWLDYVLVVVDMFGLKFEQRYQEIAQRAISFSRIIKNRYGEMSLKDKRVSLTIFLKIMIELKKFYNQNSLLLATLLDEIGLIVDLEHAIVEEKLWTKLKEEDPEAKEALGPWALAITIANHLLTLSTCKDFTVWFASRRYLSNMIKCTCNLLTYKDSLPAGKLALYSLTLYLKSPLAHDFLNINMLQFYDQIEPLVTRLLSGYRSKVNILDLKEAWLIFTLVMKFQQAFIRKFQKASLETCFAFLTLNELILGHIMSLPENTVDLTALDLLSQTLIFYDEMLTSWKVEWYRKSNKTFTFMIDGIRKVINACIYLCLRPKHIGYYFLDNHYRLIAVEQDSASINDLMISVINRLIGILGLAFSCLYKLNSNLLELFDFFAPDESIIVLIQNDFSVPRFELPIPCKLTYGKLLCLSHFLCKTMNQLHQKNTEKSLKINESKYAYYIGLVEHQDPSEYLPNQKLSSFLRYIYEYSGLIDPWINNLNYKNVQKTADMLMLFIAQQAFLTIRLLEPHQVPYYKRNLYSELQFFNDFVKKHTSELESSKMINSIYKGDLDGVRRYVLSSWHKNGNNQDSKDAVAEENFLLIISFWFSNICQIQ